MFFGPLANFTTLTLYFIDKLTETPCGNNLLHNGRWLGEIKCDYVILPLYLWFTKPFQLKNSLLSVKSKLPLLIKGWKMSWRKINLKYYLFVLLSSLILLHFEFGTSGLPITWFAVTFGIPYNFWHIPHYNHLLFLPLLKFFTQYWWNICLGSQLSLLSPSAHQSGSQ